MSYTTKDYRVFNYKIKDMKLPNKIVHQEGSVVRIQKTYDNDVEYIRKDALMEWAKERYKSTISNVGCYTGHSVWQEVIEHINEM